MTKRIFGFEVSVLKDLFRIYVFHARFLAKHICWLIIKKLGKKNLTLHTEQGRFTVSLQDNAIGRSLFTKGQFEYDFSLQAVELLLKKGFIKSEHITFLDVGANIGIISIGLLLKGRIAQSIAIEPEKTNFGLLLKNIKANNLESKMLCFPLALGDNKAVRKMELSPDNLGDHRIQRSDVLTSDARGSAENRNLVFVECVTLDELIHAPEIYQKKWTFDNAILWIDVQGHEGYVFKGADLFLSQGVPTVSEIWPQGILSSGMSLEEFSDIVKSRWSDYWVLRGKRFVRYPTTLFDRYLDEIEDSDGNVIFTNESRKNVK
jgi:FkbM family methyltransferase